MPCKRTWGNAGGVYPEGVDIGVTPYPNFSPLPLAVKRNAGEMHGPCAKLTDTGIKILCTGVYEVNIELAFVNFGPGTQLLVFLLHEPLTGPVAPPVSSIAASSSNSLGPGAELQFVGFGRLKLRKGDRLFFALANGVGAPLSVVNLRSWQISVAD